MLKPFWNKKGHLGMTTAQLKAKLDDVTKVTANPTLAGTEADLTGLEVGDTKYKVPAPINVVANPTLAGTEADLTGLEVGDTKYKIPAGGGKVYNHCIQITANGFTGTNKPKALINIASADSTPFTKATLMAYMWQHSSYFMNFVPVSGDAGASNKCAIITHFAQVGTTDMGIAITTYTYTTDGTSITISTDLSTEYLSSNNTWLSDIVYEA